MESHEKSNLEKFFLENVMMNKIFDFNDIKSFLNIYKGTKEKFFWMEITISSQKSNKKIGWVPYKEIENIKIEYHYQKYLIDKLENFPCIGKYKICFEKMLQFDSEETEKYRPIVRVPPEKISTLLRKTRFDASYSISNFKPVNIDIAKMEQSRWIRK